MQPAFKRRSKLILFITSNRYVRHLYESKSPPNGVRSLSSRLEEPPEPIPNRPLRGEIPRRKNFDNDDNRSSQNKFNNSLPFSSMNQTNLRSSENKNVDFRERFNLGFHKEETPLSQLGKKGEEMLSKKSVPEPPITPPQDVDEIFKKMKETGLIPNLIAMLDGLCKDGLPQEALKLFGLMREKGTIPEVVVYTAAVDGFCKAHKLDDATRIFKKMQKNGIVRNTFSYTVLIQGLCKGKNLDDALEYCVEMLEAGHSPNLATFVDLVDGFCREKGLDEAKSVIVTLKQKGYFFDEKAGKEYMEKRGPFSPLVWEAIFGKKDSERMRF